MSKISQTASNTRVNRKIHRWISIPFAFFLFIISLTAILLAWKKELKLIPITQQSKVEFNPEWISMNAMIAIGQSFMRDSMGKAHLIDRIDVRPDKGIAKIVFKGNFTEIQLDGYSGEILSVSQRNSDLIEKIHDGSIIDFLFDSESENAKLFYSTITAVVLIFLCLTGFYLWYNPRKIKRLKKSEIKNKSESTVTTL